MIEVDAIDEQAKQLPVNLGAIVRKQEFDLDPLKADAPVALQGLDDVVEPTISEREGFAAITGKGLKFVA